jgi:exodeoxyribonuclease VII large subunit
LEDLWAFNDEQVARAIFDCSIPVITGIGHETDFTLADFAADFRAPTPTGAAVAATPDILDIGLDLQAMQNVLRQTMESCIDDRREQLNTQKLFLQRYSPQRKIYEIEQQFDQLVMTLQRVIKYQHGTRQQALAHLSQKLATADPRKLLKRGYVMLNDEVSGEGIQSIEQVQPDQALRITLFDGVVFAKSEKIIKSTTSGGSAYERN